MKRRPTLNCSVSNMKSSRLQIVTFAQKLNKKFLKEMLKLLHILYIINCIPGKFNTTQHSQNKSETKKGSVFHNNISDSGTGTFD